MKPCPSREGSLAALMTGSAPSSCDCDVGCTAHKSQYQHAHRHNTNMTQVMLKASMTGLLHSLMSTECRTYQKHTDCLQLILPCDGALLPWSSMAGIAGVLLQICNTVRCRLQATFAVRSKATPSILPLSILSQMSVWAVPGCAANASMRLPCIACIQVLFVMTPKCLMVLHQMLHVSAIGEGTDGCAQREW